MLFKKLEICGFKSFPDLMELKFDKGVTVIVGPNGCGKTNILDSIRWVLGEQSSKMLRGREMTDLIFTGGSDKKPKGMADVSLTLLDTEGVLPTEYSEVTITRRLFRSGESEYLLNRNACRLKDIQELFMDTGLGADAYSIIEQSQTDLILSNNPALRRSLFEEAAGITKYKARKKETLRKLETTEQNLLRVYDIVAEVKRQMNSLKRQAGRAERYKKFHDERLGLELKLDSFYFYDLDEKRRKHKQDLTGMQDEREGVSARISKYEAEIEKLDLEAMQLEDRLSFIHDSRKNFFEKVEKLTKEIAEIEERVKGKDFREKVLIREIEEDELKLRELERDLIEKQNEILTLDNSIIAQEKEISLLEKGGEDAAAKNKKAGLFLIEKEGDFNNVEAKLWEKNKLKLDLEKEQREMTATKDSLMNLIKETEEKVENFQKIKLRKNKLEELKCELKEKQKLLMLEQSEREGINRFLVEAIDKISECIDYLSSEYNFVEDERLAMKNGREVSLRNTESRLELIAREFKNVNLDIEKLLEEKGKRFSELEEIKSQCEVFERERDRLAALDTERKINFISVKERKTACLELEKRLNGIIASGKEKILTKTDEIALIKKTRQEEIACSEEKRKNLERIKNENDRESFDREGIEKKEKELRLNAKQAGDRVKEERVRLRALEENIAGLQVKEAEFRIQEDNLRQKMQDVYKCSCPPREKLENSEEVKSRIEFLRGEMDQMGLVNMMALEEYRGIEERFNFLSSQQKDLEDAKNNLNDTIAKINKESVERFKSTFDKIKENFAQVFGKFFKGGRADIVLTGDDALESDIEIIAQPPGKKPENIQLLSGGERALTAIGLLLSIFMVKPSPFLILDEVDAPLDDLNIRRFTEVIMEFSKNTQFIIITHNKKTMETADCLYGVTMEEPGISKIVSVSFKKEEYAEGNVTNTGAAYRAPAVETGAMETESL